MVALFPSLETWKSLLPIRERLDEAAIGEVMCGHSLGPEAPERITAVLGDDVKPITSLRHPVDGASSAFGEHLRQA